MRVPGLSQLLVLGRLWSNKNFGQHRGNVKIYNCDPDNECQEDGEIDFPGSTDTLNLSANMQGQGEPRVTCSGSKQFLSFWSFGL